MILKLEKLFQRQSAVFMFYIYQNIEKLLTIKLSFPFLIKKKLKISPKNKKKKTCSMIKEKWIKYKFNCWLKNRIEFEMVENLQHMRWSLHVSRHEKVIDLHVYASLQNT